MKAKVSKLDQIFVQAHTFHQSGDLSAAELLYRKLLQKTPGDVEVLFLLGTLHMQRGDFETAQPLLQRVLALRPQHAEALNNLGLGLSYAGRYEEALAMLERALKLKPKYGDAWNNLGSTLEKLERLDEAETAYRRLMALEPQRVDGFYNLGLILKRRERWKEAEACLLCALELVPNRVATLNDLGGLYHEMGRLREGAAVLRRAVALDPSAFDAHNNLAACLQDLGQLPEALAHYQTACALHPEDPLPPWNIAFVELTLGHLEIGWAAYELRWNTFGDAKHPPFLTWRGEELHDRSILVYPEQGLGDEILFASCLPDVLAQTGRAVIICDRRLGALYTRSFPTAVVHAVRSPGAADWACQMAECDYQIAVGSLPRLLRTRIEDFPDRPAYLYADPMRVAEWRNRLATLGTGSKVGICWRSGLRSGTRHRIYTPVEAWEPILTLPGITFVNLQYSYTPEELAEIKALFGIEVVNFHDLDLRDDQDGVAALMSALDVVVSAPTAVAELAAALGVPVLRYSWTWTSLGTHDMPWHPTMRVFARSDAEAPWDQTMATMAAALREQLAMETRPIVDINRGPMIIDPAAVLTQALAAHAQKNWDDAEQRCRQILVWYPQHADSWHLLGVVLRERGAWEEAIDALDQAYAANPKEPTILLNRGRVRQDIGQSELAIRDFRAALELDTACLETRLSLGEMLDAEGAQDEALAILQPALAHAADNAWFTAQVHWAIAQALHHQHRLNEAEQHLREAVRLDPAYPGAHSNLGNVLRDQGRLNEALACHQKALMLKPDLPGFHNNLGSVLRDLGRLPEAEAAYREALRLQPNDANTWNTLGNLLQECNHEEAIQAYRRALEIKPDDLAPHFNIAFSLFATGELTEGWNAYEWRWVSGLQGSLLQRHPNWQGEDLTGCTVLLLPEQGLGDEIMFASCIPDVLDRAERVVLICQERLASLYARSFPTAQIVAMPSGLVQVPHDLPACDYQIAIGSLPRLLRARIEDFPDRLAYLQADPAKTEYWRARLDELGLGLKIGVCWRSGLRIGIRGRYYAALSDWEPILRTPDVIFINLQYDDCAEELAEAQAQFGVTIHNFSDLDLRDDQDGVAALISAMDGVISAPTAVAELAAALGAPVLRFGLAWTSFSTDDMPWHPTMRLFRANPQDWRSTTTAMAEALAEWVAQSNVEASVAELPFQLADTQHGAMLIAGNQPAALSLLRNGDYAPETQALLASLLRSGDWVVEAGAGFGAFTLPLARAVGSEGWIVACEPDQALLRLLRANLALNGIRQVHAECSALDGTTPDESGEAGTAWLCARRPPFASIDALALPRCDLIRIDAGVDAETVLNGAQATLEHYWPFIHIAVSSDSQNDGDALRTVAGYAWQKVSETGEGIDWLGYPTGKAATILG